jgi:hypothetical protein
MAIGWPLTDSEVRHERQMVGRHQRLARARHSTLRTVTRPS